LSKRTAAPATVRAPPSEDGRDDPCFLAVSLLRTEEQSGLSRPLRPHFTTKTKIQGAEPGDALVEELRTHARERLASFKVPKHIFFVDDLPRNTAGKILKRELRERFAGKISADA
jgi:acyl-CoA synthetase (AMP-forming)/AMP-acid ligase II